MAGIKVADACAPPGPVCCQRRVRGRAHRAARQCAGFRCWYRRQAVSSECLSAQPAIIAGGPGIIGACLLCASLLPGRCCWPRSLRWRQALPPEVEAALARAKLPRDAVSVLVVDADGKSAPRLSHRAGVPVNPASVAKLATTFAALELLGPAFTWTTPVYVEGSVRDGTLHGNLYIKGQGDPKLVRRAAVAAAAPRAGAGHPRDQRATSCWTAAPSKRLRTTPAPSTASRCGPTTPRPMRCCSTSSRWS